MIRATSHKIIRDNDKTSRNIEQAYKTNKYIVSYRSIYQPFYSANNGGYYAMEVYYSAGPMTLAGRYFHYTGEQCNHLIGIELLNNL
jgi:hypothetical protein